MKNIDLRSFTVEELKQRLVAEKETLQKLKFAHAITPIENPMKLRSTRKTIAKILTELKVKEQQTN
ncbi:MAG: 50S ribosomal protein L29 [Cyclobacteriaceae bacterium]|jgi:large subunit ribosomal protein L29|nr:50S ribosomal protein L29 [Cyclobacteriaceae bacterium]